MPLTLTIRNADHLDNGSPLSLVLDRRGAIIGRAATADWCLPDPAMHISSRHCEIRFVDERYELVDHSTNGTFLHGHNARLDRPHVIVPGDVIVIGQFEIVAAMDDQSAGAALARNAAPPVPQWKGWTQDGPGQAAPASNLSAWDAPPPGSAISGSGPMSQHWAPPTAAGEPPTVASAWNVAPPPPNTPASDWSSPVSAPQAPGGDDIWGKFAASNVVDWARGGFGGHQPASSPSPSVQAPAAKPTPPVAPAPLDPAPAAPPPFAQAPPVPPPAAPQPASSGGLQAFLTAAGIDPARLQQNENDALGSAGSLMLRLVAGLVVLLEARARAKSQMGAQGTSLEFDGNNPLKFARTPENALTQLLNPPERGFMTGERAIEDAFKDLQAHQMATLKAMQGALRATLDRFSPNAIRSRAESRGLLAKILPSARDAELWKAYEREFSGVALGSDEAFMDMFAKEFRRAYEEIARRK
ncbi:MAG: type VI secretion system-associated FHA domain protein TagH [Caenibius sp.]